MPCRRVAHTARDTMTDRLYYTDAYLTSFDARITARSDDGRRIFLDRTAFYPTSGGQPNDLGILAGVAVIDVVDEGEQVAHLLAEPLAAGDGAEVHGELQRERRFDHMQQHTGQHLLSALAADHFGRETLSVHFGPQYATLDLAGTALTVDQLHELEERANAIVTENLAVRVDFEEAAQARGLRKPSEREGVLRIVTIDGIDRSACGGTHVRATGEIGPVLLRRQEKVRRGTRLEFLCGARAVRRARRDYNALAAMAQSLSCSIDELPALIAAQGEERRTLEQERRRQEGELAVYRARERYEALPAGADGLRRTIEARPTGKADDARHLALAFCALPGTVFVATVAEPPAVLVAASDDSGVDAGRMLKEALAAVGGRGGGSPRLAQGTVPDPAALQQVVRTFGVAAPDAP